MTDISENRDVYRDIMGKSLKIDPNDNINDHSRFLGGLFIYNLHVICVRLNRKESDDISAKIQNG